jgi:hypothetical protein
VRTTRITASALQGGASGEPYFLFVDGAGGACGAYTLTLSLAHSGRGSGHVVTVTVCPSALSPVAGSQVPVLARRMEYSGRAASAASGSGRARKSA